MSKKITVTATWQTTHEIEVDDNFELPEPGAQLHRDSFPELNANGAELQTIEYDG